MEPRQRLGLDGDLRRELPRGRDHEDAHPRPPGHGPGEQRLKGRDEEAQGFSGAGLGLADEVLALQRRGHGRGLDLRAGLVAQDLAQGALGQRRDRELLEARRGEVRRRRRRHFLVLGVVVLGRRRGVLGPGGGRAPGGGGRRAVGVCDLLRFFFF